MAWCGRDGCIAHINLQVFYWCLLFCRSVHDGVCFSLFFGVGCTGLWCFLSCALQEAIFIKLILFYLKSSLSPRGHLGFYFFYFHIGLRACGFVYGFFTDFFGVAFINKNQLNIALLF